MISAVREKEHGAAFWIAFVVSFAISGVAFPAAIAFAGLAYAFSFGHGMSPLWVLVADSLVVGFLLLVRLTDPGPGQRGAFLGSLVGSLLFVVLIFLIQARVIRPRSAAPSDPTEAVIAVWPNILTWEKGAHDAGRNLRLPGEGGNMEKMANARFTIKSWDEKPYSEGQDLPKLTRAAVTKTFSGDIEGEGQVEYLMMYRSDGSATFVGLERVVGRVAGKAGSFVLQRTGMFEGGVARESYSVIPGSGTGELRGLRGEGTSAVGHGNEHPLTLNYELV